MMGEASHQRWPGDLRVTDAQGRLVQPTHVGLLVRAAEQELAGAADASARDRAQTRLAFLRRHVSEIVYDLSCPAGHPVLTTMPRLVTAVRRAKGTWVPVPFG